MKQYNFYDLMDFVSKYGIVIHSEVGYRFCILSMRNNTIVKVFKNKELSYETKKKLLFNLFYGC